MKYCWSLIITDLEDLADLKFYFPYHWNRLRKDKNLVRITLYQTVLKFFKKDFILHSHDWKCWFFDRRVRLRLQWTVFT